MSNLDVMQIRKEIDVPPGEVFLRTGIYDLNSGNRGTVGVTLNVTQISEK